MVVRGAVRLNVRFEHARRQLDHLSTVDEVLLKVAESVVDGEVHQDLGERIDAGLSRRTTGRRRLEAPTSQVVVDPARRGYDGVRRRTPSGRVAEAAVHLAGQPVDESVDEVAGGSATVDGARAVTVDRRGTAGTRPRDVDGVHDDVLGQLGADGRRAGGRGRQRRARHLHRFVGHDGGDWTQDVGRHQFVADLLQRLPDDRVGQHRRRRSPCRGRAVGDQLVADSTDRLSDDRVGEQRRARRRLVFVARQLAAGQRRAPVDRRRRPTRRLEQLVAERHDRRRLVVSQLVGQRQSDKFLENGTRRRGAATRRLTLASVLVTDRRLLVLLHHQQTPRNRSMV